MDMVITRPQIPARGEGVSRSIVGLEQVAKDASVRGLGALGRGGDGARMPEVGVGREGLGYAREGHERVPPIALPDPGEARQPDPPPVGNIQIRAQAMLAGAEGQHAPLPVRGAAMLDEAPVPILDGLMVLMT